MEGGFSQIRSHINSDLVFKEIYSFTLTGHGINQSVIICSSSASIIVGNADSFTVKNIAFIDCQKLLMSPNEKFYVSLLFYDCNYVNMQNLYVNVRYNVSNAPKELTGISLINVFYSMISNVKVQVSTLMCHTHPISLSGLAIRYNVRAKV